MIQRLRDALSGYKTYIIAAIAILYALLTFIGGGSVVDLVNTVLIALGLGSLRDSVSTLRRDIGL